MENVQKRRTSIKRSFVLFSVILFLVIFFGGSAIFIISRWQIAHVISGQELVQEVEIERIKLEASVNSEITIAMKMADSPLIKRHFLHPEDNDLRRIAFEEIVGYREAFASNAVFWCSDTDKEFYFDEGNHYTIDPDDPDNYWYKMTLYETDRYNFNINYNAEMQRIMLWINAPVFDKIDPRRPKPIGLVGTGIDLSEFINAMYKGYQGSAELFFFNTLGEITAALDMNLITSKVHMDEHLGVVGEEILAIAEAMKSGDIQFFNTTGGGVTALGEVPTLDWYITAILPVTIADSLNSPMTAIFFGMMAVIAVIFVIFYFFILWLVKPLNVMVTALDQISADWDLTRRLHLHHHDEIGTLGDFFNLTFEKMRELLLDIKAKTFSLTDTGDELASYMTKTAADVEGVNASIQGMRGQVLSQADKVNAAASSIEHIITGLDKLNEHITVQAESVARSSSAVEEMLASIQSVTQTLVKNTANISSLADSSEAGRVDLQNVSNDIQEIARESEGLLEINSVMQNIASQTNLLSMNAAIEAAHAGESGRGFAVVADEIRKLAENSGVQSKTISAVLKKIKSSIDTITKSTGIVLERFGTIEQEVQTVSNQETQIRSAMEEQGAGSRLILDAITQLNSVTDLVRKASTDMTAESREVMNQSGELKRITTEVAGSMDEMTQNVDEISGAVTRVQEISEENKENIDALSGDVARFKVE